MLAGGIGGGLVLLVLICACAARRESAQQSTYVAPVVNVGSPYGTVPAPYQPSVASNYQTPQYTPTAPTMDDTLRPPPFAPGSE